ncbi:MAG TPA: HtaA domain-containing protein [Solirubrobacterales bacterium]
MRLLAGLLAAVVAALLLGGAAAHADSPNTAKLRLGKHAARALGAQNVKLRAVAPARRRGRAVTLPIRSGEVSSIARVRLKGALKLTARKGRRRRSVRLQSLAATIQAGRALLTARLRGTQYTLGRLRGVDEVAPFNPITGEVDTSGKLRLDGYLRRELQRRLRVRRLPRGLGRVRVRGTLPLAPPSEAEPELLERPETAVDVSEAQLHWRIRESFVCYVHSAGGPGVSAADGAVLEEPVAYPPPHLSTPCSDPPPSVPLPYTVIYGPAAFAEGWFDPVTGAASLRLRGSVRFEMTAHHLDVGAYDPIVEVTADGGGRLIHDYVEYWRDPERSRLAVTGDFARRDLEPTVEAGPEGVTYTYERIPLTNAHGPEASPLARYYPPGAGFGWMTVSFTVPEGGE